MRGMLLSYDPTTDAGVITGDDLTRYGFSGTDFGGAPVPAPGRRVDFVPKDGRAQKIALHGASSADKPANPFAPGPMPTPMPGDRVHPRVAAARAGLVDTAPPAFSTLLVRCFYPKYIDGRGRAGRREYGVFIAFAGLSIFAALTLFLISILIYGAPTPDNRITPPMSLGLTGTFLFFFWCLILIPPFLAVTSRRLHDLRLPGWLCLIALVPYLGPLVALALFLIPGRPAPAPSN